MVCVKIIQDLYEEARTSVTSVCEKTEDFTVIVGVHLGYENKVISSSSIILNFQSIKD